MTTMTEGEKWARIVIFCLVGVYSVVLFVLAVKYVIRNYFSSHRQRSTLNPIVNNHICRRQQRFLTEYFDDDLPQFEAALKYPIPTKTIFDIEPPPPTYEDYVNNFCSCHIHPPQTFVQEPTLNFLETDESKLHM